MLTKGKGEKNNLIKKIAVSKKKKKIPSSSSKGRLANIASEDSGLKKKKEKCLGGKHYMLEKVKQTLGETLENPLLKPKNGALSIGRVIKEKN